MKDVAAKAGVSLKTVSRVINNEVTVNPDLAARVRAAAAELRYQPNFGASALRRSDGRSSTIGVLLEDLSNPFSATIFRAIEDVASEKGFSVVGGSLNESAEREEELIRSMTRHRVDGLVIAPSSRDHSYLVEEQEAGVVMVFIDRPPVGIEADLVTSDSRAGSEAAVRHLLQHGHTSIAYLGDMTHIQTAQERLLGYKQALTAANVKIDPALVVENLRDSNAAFTATKNLFTLPSPPTALFTGQNNVTIGAVRALRELGLQNEVALIGFDDFVLADLLEPAVSVVAQDIVEIGRRAAEKLFARLSGDEAIPEISYVPTTLHARGSGEIVPKKH